MPGHLWQHPLRLCCLQLQTELGQRLLLFHCQQNKENNATIKPVLIAALQPINHTDAWTHVGTHTHLYTHSGKFFFFLSTLAQRQASMHYTVPLEMHTGQRTHKQ